MNYLAHLYLADPCPQSVLGNLLGDFMRGADLAEFPERVQAGVHRHRAVDAFTDGHPVVARSRARVSPRLQRYAGVLVDLFYDHFLAREWDRYSPDIPLTEFTRGVYRVILSQERWLTARLRWIAPRMAAGDWLAAYKEPENIDRALAGMSRRLRHENPLAECGQELRADYGGFAADFAAFFPQLVDHVRSLNGNRDQQFPPRPKRDGG